MKNFRLLSGPPLVFRFLSPGSSHAAYVRRLRKIFIDNFQLGSMTNGRDKLSITEVSQGRVKKESRPTQSGQLLNGISPGGYKRTVREISH